MWQYIFVFLFGLLSGLGIFLCLLYYLLKNPSKLLDLMSKHGGFDEFAGESMMNMIQFEDIESEGGD